MAFQKDIQTPFGIAAGYWNIGEEHKDYRENTNRVVFYGYANNAARVAKGAPMASAQIVIDKADFQPNMTRAEIYTYAKANQSDFTDAVDV